jgi:RNA polymerase sigma-70 factor (ECF subfamily)
MRQLAESTQAQFNRLYEAEFDYVWNSLRRLGVASAHLEDVAHDVFVTAWKKWADYDARRPLRPWLFGIAYRLASDFRDRAWHRREVSEAEPDSTDEAPTPEVHAQTRQARALVHRAMESMPLERRAVFVMHEIDGLPVPEVAQALAVPLNTAYSRLRLARRDFATAIERLRGKP